MDTRDVESFRCRSAVNKRMRCPGPGHQAGGHQTSVSHADSRDNQSQDKTTDLSNRRHVTPHHLYL